MSSTEISEDEDLAVAIALSISMTGTHQVLLEREACEVTNVDDIQADLSQLAAGDERNTNNSTSHVVTDPNVLFLNENLTQSLITDLKLVSLNDNRDITDIQQPRNLPLSLPELPSEPEAYIRSEICSICLETLTPQNQRFLPCAHKFHRECVEPWLQNNDACPDCRTTVQEQEVPPPTPPDNLRKSCNIL
ncbi:DZIP3 [Bugula neritina]|uniref:DZIP3 n=1 Tax=Bugula neritina TaxID=10212 RepID=A0A7J7IXS4_BUGNE|nr:DZIP3 [Bugula neritina]